MMMILVVSKTCIVVENTGSIVDLCSRYLGNLVEVDASLAAVRRVGPNL